MPALRGRAPVEEMSAADEHHPLNRYTRLERGKPPKADPEKQRDWERRSRKPLPAKSKRREEETPERQALVAQVLRERPACEAQIPGVCTHVSTEVNEIIRRSQWRAGYLVKANTEGLCHNCHACVTARPGWAERHGHQLTSDAREDLSRWDDARRVRAVTSGRCGLDCATDHREETNAGPPLSNRDDR